MNTQARPAKIGLYAFWYGLLFCLWFFSCLSSVFAADEAELFIKYFKLYEGRLAFAYRAQDSETRDIWVLDFDSLETFPLVEQEGDDECPEWSPDGKSLVFHGGESGESEIFRVGYDGNGLRRLTDSRGPDEHPRWSPDGKRIVFDSARQSGSRNVYVMNADGSDPRPLTSTRKKSLAPAWSPDGTRIVYWTNVMWPRYNLVIHSLKDKSERLLPFESRSICRPSWSPDGESFVFSLENHGTADIWVRPVDGKGSQLLIQRPGREYDPVWSPDGKMLFFVGETEPNSDRFELFLYEAQTKEVHQVTQSRGSVRFPAWTPVVLRKSGFPKGSSNEIDAVPSPSPVPSSDPAPPTAGQIPVTSAASELSSSSNSL